MTHVLWPTVTSHTRNGILTWNLNMQLIPETNSLLSSSSQMSNNEVIRWEFHIYRAWRGRVVRAAAVGLRGEIGI